MQMKKVKDIPNYKDRKFVKGLRVGNISIKIYEGGETNYLVVQTKYFLGFPIYKREMIVDDYEKAEDLVHDLRFDGQWGKIRMN